MGLTVKDFDDIWNGAQADFERAKFELEADMFGPVARAMLQRTWLSMSPMQKGMLRAMMGEENYLQAADGLEGRNKNAY